MPESREKAEQKSNQDLKDATEKLPQPFKFIATILFVTLPQTSNVTKTIIVLLFTLLLVVFALASLKGIAGVDFFFFLNPANNTYYYSVTGDIVLKGSQSWSPSNSGIEFTSAKILYTRKEFMNMGYFRLLWIIRFPNTELESGEIDLTLTRKIPSGRDILIASSLKKYADLFNPEDPYRWVHLVVDTSLSIDKIQRVLPNN